MFKQFVFILALSTIVSQNCVNKKASEGKDCEKYTIIDKDLEELYKDKNDTMPSKNNSDYKCCYLKAQFEGIQDEVNKCYPFFKGDVNKDNIEYTISRINSGQYDFWNIRADVEKLDCNSKIIKSNILPLLVFLLLFI